ncbi:flagellar assembly protein FliH [Shewanella sp. VB17]|uniref:flagellar assembly protein FliH n=1 Tax=Shewanella sp. VB17 TaxID=2739432 RepID=UPI001564ECAD|nr:flagellar assembly protein FliH [Shewanella sp. VB17]NRD73345.1 flagellar assembly protein FliH [Shewanella sp. VB17]
MKHTKHETSTEAAPQETESEFTHWHIPDITEVPSEDALNLFGRKMVQKILVEEHESILPPTLIQIEEIRQEAEKEGFAQGKEEGHQVGLDTGRLEGLKQGHGEGFEQGTAQGYQEGMEKAIVLVKRFEGLLEQFEKPLELLDSEIEQELVSLTLKLSRAVIHHEINTHPEHVLAALRQGVDSLSLRGQEVVIRLHPDDHELTQELYTINQLEKNRWDLEIDPSLARGDCVILSQRSSVDMRLESRISAVLEELENHHENLNQVVEQQKNSLSTAAMMNKLDPLENAINPDVANVSDDEPDNEISGIDNQLSGDELDNEIGGIDNQLSGDELDNEIDGVDNQLSGDEQGNEIDGEDNQLSGDELGNEIGGEDNQLSGDELGNEIDGVDNQLSGDELGNEIDGEDNQLSGDELGNEIDGVDNQLSGDEPDNQMNKAGDTLSDGKPE